MNITLCNDIRNILRGYTKGSNEWLSKVKSISKTVFGPSEDTIYNMLDYKQKIEDDEVADINNNVSTTINQKEQEEDSQKEGVRVVQIVTPENLPTETSSVSSCQVGTDILPPPMPPNSISTNSAFSIKTTTTAPINRQMYTVEHEPTTTRVASPPPIADTDCCICIACTNDNATSTTASLQSPKPKRPSRASMPTLQKQQEPTLSIEIHAHIQQSGITTEIENLCYTVIEKKCEASVKPNQFEIKHFSNSGRG